MKFKVGDRVTWGAARQYGVGTEEELDYPAPGRVAVRFDDYRDYDDSSDAFDGRDRHMPLIKDLTLYNGERTAEKIQEAAFKRTEDSFALSKEWDEQEPKVPYYQFPGGVEVRQISAHLMSFPSQIMQYASRSGRVDGNCKSEDVSDKIRDFEKIIDFARWEIERLENQ